MLIGYIGYYIGRGNLPVALPLLSETFGYSNEQLGLILTASELAYAVGKITVGPLADWWGGKRVFLIGILGAIAFNVIFSFGSTLLYFGVVWCLCRFCLSMGWSGVIKTIGEWYEPEVNGTITGFISINFQFGSVIAAVFAGYLLHRGISWQGLFLYPALVMTVVAIWAALASRESPQEVYPGVRFGRNAGQKGSIAHFVRHSGGGGDVRTIAKTLLRLSMFRQILVFAFLSTFLRSIFMFWTPKFLVDVGMGHVAAAMSSAVFPLLGCLGTVFLGWYTDRYATQGDRARMMWIMLCGLVVCLLAVAWLVPQALAHPYALVAFLGFSGFFLYGPYSMSAGCMTLDIAGAEGAGTCAGLVDGVGYFGGALASWMAGIVSSRLGWAQVFLMLAACAVLSVLSAYQMSRTYRRRV
jgi:OPA family glycerol-3-phosphate transporter-like MFS transporter